MCIVSFHFQQHPKYKLIIAANRDEFYRRPAEALHFWPDEPNILAGRDLEAKGTWLGMTKDGKFATLTNYRHPKYFNDQDKRSRGDIVTNFLTGSTHPETYLQQLHERRHEYSGFNIIVGNADELYYYGNEQGEVIKIEPGTHSLCNQLLNTPWPKVKRAKSSLNDYVMNNETINPDELFIQLQDDTVAPDEELPDTGIGLERERQVSPIFIRTEDYGTRVSTVILITHDNQVQFIERTFYNGEFEKEVPYEFIITEK